MRNIAATFVRASPDAAGAGEKPLSHVIEVYENVDFFARLFGHDKAEREARAARCCWNSTGPASRFVTVLPGSCPVG